MVFVILSLNSLTCSFTLKSITCYFSHQSQRLQCKQPINKLFTIHCRAAREAAKMSAFCVDYYSISASQGPPIYPCSWLSCLLLHWLSTYSVKLAIQTVKKKTATHLRPKSFYTNNFGTRKKCKHEQQNKELMCLLPLRKHFVIQ